MGGWELVLPVELEAALVPDDLPVVGGGGVVRTTVLLAVDAGLLEIVLARVIEIFTSLGWMPNFSRVEDTASDRAPWKLSSLDWLSATPLFCAAVGVLVSDDNMLCK